MVLKLYQAGMPTGSNKIRGTTFCGKLDGELPLPVRSSEDPLYCQVWFIGLLGFNASATARVNIKAVKWWWWNQFSGGGNRSTRRKPPTYGTYTVRNYLLGFRWISGVNILVQKKRISAVRRKIGMPDRGLSIHGWNDLTYIIHKNGEILFFLYITGRRVYIGEQNSYLQSSQNKNSPMISACSRSFSRRFPFTISFDEGVTCGVI